MARDGHYRVGMSVDYQTSAEFVRFAERLADAARAETLPRFRAGGEIVNKSQVGFDPVTDADRMAEQVLRRMIRETHPEHGIIGEEFGSENDSAEWRWVLDPVDGTRAFVCGIASWTTLVALEKFERPIVGVIDQPFTDERWIGVGREATYTRGGASARCRVSDVKHLKGARISTTDPRGGGYFSPQEAGAFASIAKTASFARFGLDAYAYGLVALGELDLVVEAGLKRHDFAALIPIIEGAGGIVSDWRGDSPGNDKRGRIIAAASRELHAEALAHLRAV